MDRQIVVGSLSDVAMHNSISLAETFIGCDTIVLVDTSGSMEAHDSRGGQTRYNVACAELAALQKSNAGRIGVIAFSADPIFVPGGIPPMLGASTNLARALAFARVADVEGIRFVVISDGQPDDEKAALAEAAQYKAPISTVYVGPEGERSGREFLERLASSHGGRALHADRAQELAAAVQTLMLAG